MESSNPKNDNNTEENNKPNDHQTKHSELLSHKDKEILKTWEKEQENLVQKLILKDDHDWVFDEENKGNENNLKYIGGCDISFSTKYKDLAVSALIVVNLDMEIVYEKYKIVKMTEPYIPGFLAFREAKHIIDLLNLMQKEKPEFYPQVLLCDSNGILHPKKFGLACHLGVLTGISTIGCSKNMYAVDGITQKGVKEMISKKKPNILEPVPLTGNSGFLYGYLLLSTKECSKPIIVSPGHKISYETCIKIVKFCIKFRVPEPIRMADKCSRQLINYLNNLSLEEIDNFDLEQFILMNKNELHNMNCNNFKVK